MAKASKTPIAPVIPLPGVTPLGKYVVSQQALNLIRQIVNAQGWAKSVEDIYLGGRMLAKHLPPLDPLDWVKNGAELKAMTEQEQLAYLERDKAWGDKQVTLNLGDKQVDIVKRAFAFFVDKTVQAQQLGPNQYLFEIIEAFGIVSGSEDQDAPAE